MPSILSLAENISTFVSQPVLLVLSVFSFGRQSAAYYDVRFYPQQL